MSKFTEVDLILGKVSSQAPYVVAIWEDTDGENRVAWVGLSAAEVVRMLYEMADEVMRQKVPPLEPRKAH